MTRFVLGTAAFGLAYGTAIPRALPAEADVLAMLDRSGRLGFAGVDTARAYGSSEERIGRHLALGSGFAPGQVMTKLSPLPNVVNDATPSAAGEAARASLDESRRALGIDRLERVLLHRAAHLDIANGAIWHALLREQDAGRIGTVGVSVQTPAELERCLADDRVQAVQLPCNVLDRRFDNPETEARLLAARVHREVRSVFLQGVLTADNAAAFPETGAPYDSEGVAAWLRRGADVFAGGALDAFCASYVAGLAWVDGMVFGVDNMQQIERLAVLRAAPPMDRETRQRVRAARPDVPDALLDPSKWKARNRIDAA